MCQNKRGTVLKPQTCWTFTSLWVQFSNLCCDTMCWRSVGLLSAVTPPPPPPPPPPDVNLIFNVWYKSQLLTFNHEDWAAKMMHLMFILLVLHETSVWYRSTDAGLFLCSSRTIAQWFFCSVGLGHDADLSPVRRRAAVCVREMRRDYWGGRSQRRLLHTKSSSCGAFGLLPVELRILDLQSGPQQGSPHRHFPKIFMHEQPYSGEAHLFQPVLVRGRMERSH